MRCKARRRRPDGRHSIADSLYSKRMKIILLCSCVAALWALPMGKSSLATAADLVALIGAGAWLCLIAGQEPSR